MSEHFLKFKKAFHQSASSMPQMKFPTFPKLFGKLNNFGSIQCSKWMKLFSTGIIIYSAYFYLKRTSYLMRITLESLLLCCIWNKYLLFVLTIIICRCLDIQSRCLEFLTV